MNEIMQQELFTLEEAAKWCGMSPRAFYMHQRRGHVEPVKMLCHRLYFSREAVDNFRASYCAFRS